MATFEHLGWFEDYYVMVSDGSYKWRGHKVLSSNPGPRRTGSEGVEFCVLTEPVTLVAGLKTVVVKASQRKPVCAKTILYPFCGKAIKG